MTTYHSHLIYAIGVKREDGKVHPLVGGLHTDLEGADEERVKLTDQYAQSLVVVEAMLPFTEV